MDFQQSEELSFAPFHLNIPHLQTEYVPPKSLISIIQNFFSSPLLLNIIFSSSEVSYLRGKYPNSDCSTENILKLITEYDQNPSNRQAVLEELNSLAITEINHQNSIENFKKVNLQSIIFNWFQNSLSSIEKSLILNLLSLLFEFSEMPQDKLSEFWNKILESAIVSNGSLAKKHLIILFLIEYRLSRFNELKDSQLRYFDSNTQIASSESITNPLIFPFYISGNIPQSFIKGDSIISQVPHFQDKEFVEYFNTGNFSSETSFPDGRSFLLSCGNNFQKFVFYLTQLYQTNSRVISPMSRVDLVIHSDSHEIETFDLDNEKDLISLLIWSNAYIINYLLNKSNFMDGAIFRHLFTIKTSGTCLITSFFQSYSNDIKSSTQTQREFVDCMAYKGKITDEALLYPFLAISTAFAFHTIADFFSFSNRTMRSLLPEKSLKTLLSVGEQVANPLIKSEIAYFLATMLRIVPSAVKNKMGASSLKFIFLNLQQFDLLENFNIDNQIDITPKFSGEEHVAQIRKHCANLNLQSPF